MILKYDRSKCVVIGGDDMDAGENSKASQAGFTIIEVMIGICIFAIGVLAVCNMQLSGIKGSATARHYTEASTIAMDKIESLMVLPYEDGALSDRDGDGNPTSGGNLGLFDATELTADWKEDDPSGQYTIFWNVAEDDLSENTKTVSVIVVWNGTGMRRSVSMQRAIPEII